MRIFLFVRCILRQHLCWSYLCMQMTNRKVIIARTSTGCKQDHLFLCPTTRHKPQSQTKQSACKLTYPFFFVLPHAQQTGCMQTYVLTASCMNTLKTENLCPATCPTNTWCMQTDIPTACCTNTLIKTEKLSAKHTLGACKLTCPLHAA